MARKEVNVFTVAWLDVIAGALGSVIILFIIVPRIDIGAVQNLPELVELKDQTLKLEALYARIRSSVPEAEYAAMEGETRKLQSAIVKVESRMIELQNKLKRANNTVLDLEQQIAEKTNQIKGYQTTIARLEGENAGLREKIKDKGGEPPIATKVDPKNNPVVTNPTSRDSNTSKTNPVPNPNPDVNALPSEKVTLGIEAPFVAVINYDKKQLAKVNIYFQPEGKTSTVDYFNRNASFGKWRDVSRMFSGRRGECVLQDKIEPGNYILYAHLASPRKGGKAVISGFVGMNPAEGKSRKFDFKDITIESGPPPGMKGGGTQIGRIELTENSLNFIQTRN